jgi:hypothetical protein
MSYLDKLESAEAMAPQSIEKLPEGKYVAQVTHVEIKNMAFPDDFTSLSVEFTVNEGEFKGRKCWWNTRISDTTSDKAMSFIKGTICKIAGVESTNGDALGTLNSSVGNVAEISLTYSPGVKDPSKSYSNVFVNKLVDKI